MEFHCPFCDKCQFSDRRDQREDLARDTVSAIVLLILLLIALTFLSIIVVLLIFSSFFKKKSVITEGHFGRCV